LLSIIFILRFIQAIVRYYIREESPKGANSIARERYAKGEISRAEFEEIKQAINE